MGEPRQMGAVNWRGFATLYLREVRRFVKVAGQTLTAPVVTGLLFLAIFSLALGRAVETVGDVPYLEFLAPGLIMMQVVQNAFANSSSSLMISKVQGNIVDVLMAPLSAVEMTLGYALGAVTRGVTVGIVLIAAMSPFVHFEFAHPGFVIYHLVAASAMMARFCAVDLRPAHFRDGAIAQTCVALQNTIVIRDDQFGGVGFHLLTDFTGAAYLWRTIADHISADSDT